MFSDATIEEIDEAASRSWQAFQQYSHTSLKQRAALLRQIAAQYRDFKVERIQKVYDTRRTNGCRHLLMMG